MVRRVFKKPFEQAQSIMPPFEAIALAWHNLRCPETPVSIGERP
jgi:hypothetical protein